MTLHIVSSRNRNVPSLTSLNKVGKDASQTKQKIAANVEQYRPSTVVKFVQLRRSVTMSTYF